VTALEVGLALLRMFHVTETPALRARAATAAVLIVHAAERERVDPMLLAAVVVKESSARPDVRGRAGEIGMGQILPGRVSRRICAGLDLWHPPDNVRCAARYLRTARETCGGRPRDFLIWHNTGRCSGPSRYADRVLRIARRGNPRPSRAGGVRVAAVTDTIAAWFPASP